MVITLECIVDVYSKPDRAGIQKILKKDVIFKKQFETSQILAEHFIDAKGNVSKKYSTIKEGENYYKVKYKFEDISKLIGPVVINGFKLKGKRK